MRLRFGEASPDVKALSADKMATVYYILLLVAHIGFIWGLPHLPTQDGPSHIYNLVILHDLLNGGKEWGNFFVYRLRAIPNLGFILLAYPLLYFFTPLVVERIFVSVYIILLGVSVPFFLRTFNKPVFPVSYFVFPLIFNFNLLMGFYAYIVAVPLFLLAFSFAWRIRDRSAACKFVCFNIAGLTIFYFHLIPFVFFLLSLIVSTIVESPSYKKKVHNLLNLLLTLIPSILILFYYLMFTANRSLQDFSYLLSPSRYIRLLTKLLYFSTVNFLPWQIWPASLFMSSIVFLGYRTIKEFKNGTVANSEKTLIYLSLVLILIYLLAPISFGGGFYFNERFPWVILLLALPVLRIPQTFLFKKTISIIAASIVGIFFLVSIVILWQQSTKIETFLSGLHIGLPKGAFVMTYKTKYPSGTTVDILLHAVSYYGVMGGCVDVGNYEVTSDLFPVHFSKTMPAVPSEQQINDRPETINWDNYPRIQYLFGWDLDKKDREILNKYFHVIWEKELFNIWQRGA